MVRAAVQLLYCKTSFLRQKPGDERTIFIESCGIKNMSCKICKSEILKKIKQQLAKLRQTIYRAFERRDLSVSVFLGIEQRH